MSERLEPVAGEWRRVSDRYVVVDLVGTLVFGVVVVVATSVPAWATGIGWLFAIPAAFAITFLIVLAFVPRRVRSIASLAMTGSG